MTNRKTALVTGGTRGIGRAIALKLKALGYRVVAAYSQDDASARETQKEGIEIFRADVSDESDVKSLFSYLGSRGADVLVNNAGVALFKQIQDVSLSEWDRVLSVNLTGAFLCIKEAVKGMISRGTGLIVNISSVWGEVGGSCESVYSAAKAGLIGFTKALAKELAPSSVRVNCISPGVIDTAMNGHLSNAEKTALKEEIPLGRFGTGEDVAKAVAFLIENDYVTGIDIPVGGGFGF